MNIIKKAYKGVSKLTMADWGVLKLCLFSFALFIAKVIPEVLALDRRRYLVIFVVTYIWIIKRVLCDK